MTTPRASGRGPWRAAVVALVVLAVAAGVAGWLLLRAPAGALPGDGAMGGGRAAAASPAGADDDAAARAASSRAGIATTAYRGEPLDAESAENAAVLPPPADGVEVNVVMRDGGAPVAGAVVSVLDRGRIDESAYDRAQEHRPAMRAFAHFAGRYRADADGHARVPAASGVTHLRARKGNLVGWAELAPGQPAPYRVELEPERTLRVLVVDAAGMPVADVPVALVLMWDGRHDVVAAALTHGDGCASFGDLARASTPRRGAPSEEMGEPALAVAFAFPLLNPVERAVDPAHLPADPVRLQLPPTGRVTVRMGGAATGAGTRHVVEQTYLGAFRERRSGEAVEPPPRPGPPPEAPKEPVIARVEVTDAEPVTVPFVGLGLYLRCAVDPGDGEAPRPIGVDGPTEAGEEVFAYVNLANARDALHARVLGPDGEPLVKERVRLRLINAAGNEVGEAAVTMTDAGGSVNLPPPHNRDGAYTLDVTWVDGAHAARATGRSDARTLARAESADMGDVRLVVADPLVAGIVVDGVSRPVAGATVHLSHWIDEEAADDEAAEPGTDRRFHEAVVTDASGHFVVRGRTPVRRFWVRAEKAGFVWDDAVSCLRGVADARIQLLRTGALEASIKPETPPRSDLRFLTVEAIIDGVPEAILRREDMEAERRGWRQRTTPSNDLRIRCAPLRPGTATVNVMMAGTPTPLLTVTGVVIKPGERTGDARLQNLDLSTLCRTLAVRVLGPDGRPAADAWVRGGVGALTGEGGWADFRADDAGVVHVTAPSLPVDLIVMAPGHVTETISGVSADVTVRLAAPSQLVVTLPGGFRAPAPPVEIAAHLVREYRDTGEVADYTSRVAWLPGASAVTIAVPSPGHRRIVVTAYNSLTGKQQVVLNAVSFADVTPGVALARMTPAFTAADLAAAIEAVSKP